MNDLFGSDPRKPAGKTADAAPLGKPQPKRDAKQAMQAPDGGDYSAKDI